MKLLTPKSCLLAAPSACANMDAMITQARLGEDCWDGCNKQQGKCEWCGSEGYCCRQGWEGNECDGTFGGPNNHQCVLKPGKEMNPG